ncbi:hypothetical protein FB45DRAFT_802866 [Roridomyces roridus]|uniref:Uncharacterized protein n=1 Tax=Roridomyces roridus TaxID=1738132 RepID=A0AAD7B965_9AGAR|nr:hypothetical protein FB45DRAFT_802866 [Roridomyces roridus]
MALSEAGFQLLTQFLECIFWGIYIVTLGFCLRALLRWKTNSGEISKTMLVVTLLMACVATFDMVLTFLINLNAFVFYDGPGGPKAAFDNTSGWMDIMGSVDVILQTILGDIMLIYRCWLVYGRSWIAISVPIVLAIAGLVCVALSIFMEITLPSASQFDTPYKQVVVSTWAITICINVITTGLILLRIWRVDRNNSELWEDQKGSYNAAKRIIIESGLLYTTVATTTAAVYIAGSDAFAPLTGIDVQMIGIAFNLILIRVYRNRAAELRRSSDRPDCGGTRERGRQAASSLRFVTPDRSRTLEIVSDGDLEANYGESVGEGEGSVREHESSDVSTSVSVQEKKEFVSLC